MNVLILGGGGREHAFAWKIAKSSSCNKLFIAPGNAGTDEICTNVNIGVNDFESIKDFVLKEEIALVLVGPEDPLVNGIYDFFKEDENLKDVILIGPSKKGAQLEGSKEFVLCTSADKASTGSPFNKISSLAKTDVRYSIGE